MARSGGWQITIAALLMSWALGGTPRAEEPRLAIGGYDAVAYFTDAKPIPGRSDIAYMWHDARWQFASAAHRDLFVKDPEHYAPQYDGYCARGASRGATAHKDTVDPQAWAIVDGKLYLTHSREALAKWQQNARENIQRADRDWPGVEKQATIYDGYPTVLKTSSPPDASPAPAARAGGG